MYLRKYELDEEQRKATLLYDYNGQIIRYMMYMNDEDSSLGQTETDKLIDQYKLEVTGGIVAEIKEYEIEDLESSRYIADFEYMDAQYQLIGVMEKDEFENLLKNLAFL